MNLARGAFGPASLLTLVGTTHRTLGGVRIVGLLGEAKISSWRAGRVLRELSRWDGRTPAKDLVDSTSLSSRDFQDLVESLWAIGALLDRRAVWRFALRFEENPARFAPLVAVDEIYATPRWGGSPDAQLDPPPPQSVVMSELDRLAEARASVDLTRNLRVDSNRAAASAVEAASATADPRRRAVATAGDLRSGHLFVAVGSSPGTFDLLAIDGHSASTRYASVSSEALAAAFVPDAGVSKALSDGAAVILVAADPRRETAKYGDRGWRYCNLEAGSIVHHLALHLTEQDSAHRIVGGFFEEAIGRAFRIEATPLEPLISVLVTGRPFLRPS